MPVLKYLAVAVLAVVAAVPAAAQCYQWGPIGPPMSYPVTLDPAFVYNYCWSFSSNAYHDSVADVGVLPGFGTISQSHSFSGETWADYELTADITIVPGASPGTETLVVDIVDGGGGLDTIATFYPTSTSNSYLWNLVDDYDGQTINLRFRRVSGASPGTTTFKIDNVSIWVD